MTAGGFRVTALRVKLPCEDEKDFYARLADTIAEKGLRVPTANLRPVGTRVSHDSRAVSRACKFIAALPESRFELARTLSFLSTTRWPVHRPESTGAAGWIMVGISFLMVTG